MATPTDRSSIALVVLAAATWSLAGVWVQLLPDVSMPMIVAGRLALSFVALAPFVWWRRASLRLTGAAWGLALLMVGYYVFAVSAFQLAPVAEGTLFVNSSPLFAVGWALIRREPLSRGEIWGTVLALIGVVLIVLPGLLSGSDADQQRIVGDGFALLASLSMAAYSIGFQQLGDRVPSPLAVTALTFALGGVATVFLFGLEGDAAFSGLEDAASWGSLIGLGVITTAIPTVAYSVASSRLSAVVATMTRLLTPAFAAVAAWLILDEVPSVWLAPGGALVLGGLVMSLRSRR